MKDEQAENIPADDDDLQQPQEVATRDAQPRPDADAEPVEDEQLSELMATPTDQAAPERTSPAPADAAPTEPAPTEAPQADPAPTEPAPVRPKVDLEQQAIEAAAQAVAEGERAVEAAEAALAEVTPPPEVTPQPLAAPRNQREVVLRVLLVVNVIAMIVVALMPAPAADSTAAAEPAAIEPPTSAPPAPAETPRAEPTVNEPWNQALRASERREWGAAVTILEGYLASRPEMPPSERLSVLSALSFYSSRDKDFTRSRRYAQQAQALEQSHSLPADLVEEAAAAVEISDQESLRRIWARFLLQERQIPSWLYHHVAQAYLELGDSYRQDASAGARAARARELQAAAEQVRLEAVERREKR